MSAQQDGKGASQAGRRIQDAKRSNADSLDLSHLDLTAIPESVGQLVDLQKLDLNGNQITALPNHLARLGNLRELDLGFNRVTGIPDFIAQLADLRVLDLYHNQIAVIPDSLAQLTNLWHLDLSTNRITVIPDSLAQLTRLRNLDLYQNQITVIPDSLAQLRGLQYFTLYRNQLRAIPSSASQLTNLKYLDLQGNQITSVPNSLAQLTNLEHLALNGNPLPEEVFAALAGGIKSFFRYLQSTALRKVYPRTVKLVLLGEPKSGKTTLLEALKGNPEPCDDSRKETLGVDVANIQKLHPTDHAPMYLSVWDFAGQHIEHATHQFFLTENAIYLILWNARQGADSGKHDVWYWLELLKMRVRNPKFLLVATHIEHTPPDLNLSAIKPSYPGCEGNYPVELCNLKGMASLEAKILDIAAGSPSLRAEWPPEWLSVRDEIRKIREKQPHMKPAAFRSLDDKELRQG